MPILDKFNLTGRVALVTGGNRGLGQQMALALAEAGADVALTSRDQQRADEAAGEIATFMDREVPPPPPGPGPGFRHGWQRVRPSPFMERKRFAYTPRPQSKDQPVLGRQRR